MQEECERIEKILSEANADFKIIEHEAVLTSEDAARVRGTTVNIGVKALLMKCDGIFIIACVSAEKKLSFKKLKDLIKCKEVRMATQEEVVAETNCERGAVPPFGYPKPLIKLYDPSCFLGEYREFNIGLRTKSARVKSADLKRVVLAQAPAKEGNIAE